MNTHKMKQLEKALNETPLDAWQTYQRVKLTRRLQPCPALCAYASRLDLQQDYKLVHDGKQGTIWRDDGSINWQLSKYFGIEEYLTDAIFGTGGVVSVAADGSLAAAFIRGTIIAHEAALNAAVDRAVKQSNVVLPLEGSEPYAKPAGASSFDDLSDDDPFEVVPWDDEGDGITPTPAIPNKKGK